MEWDLDKYLEPSDRGKQPSQNPAAPRAERSRAEEREAQGQRPRPRQTRRRRAGSLPPWVLVLVCLLFYSFFFHVWTENHFSVGRFLTLLVLSVSFALLSSLIGTIGKKRKLQTVLAVIVVALWGVMFLVEFFIIESFNNFYTLSAMFAGAGNAGQEDFAARTTDLVLSNVWRILLFILPVAAYFLANRFLRLPRIMTRGMRRYLAAAGVLLLVVGLFFAAVISPDHKRMGKEYEFNEAVHGFGLPMGFVLDALRGSSGGDFEIEDNTVFTLPPQTSETQKNTEAPPVPPQTNENGETLEPSGTEPTAPTEPRKPYNMLNIDFEAAMSQTSSDDAKDCLRYLSSLTPSATNEMTGMFKGKNLILITAEAFSKEFITPELTPTLYRMMTKGIYFKDYYQPAWGGSTSSGEFSVLTGIDPARGAASFKYTIGHNMDITVSNQLQKLGYFTRAYHNHKYTYYDRNLTHENMGYEKFIGLGNGMEEGVTEVWPESDKEMLDFTVPQYVNQQPFSIYYMTVSGHGAYSWMGNRQSRNHQEEVQNLDCSDTVKAYIACNLEVEYAMQSLLEQLEAAGIADDTLVVLTADHYPYCLTKSDAWYTDKDYLSEYFGYTVNDCFGQDHNCLIMWSGCLEDKNIVIEEPCYSLDIVPTLCNLFGLDYDSRLLVGRDVFSDQEALVLWPNHSWKTSMGQWDAARNSNEFTPAEGVEVSQEYLDKIRRTVSNKINYSYKLLNNEKVDFFQLVFDNVK